MMEFIAGVSVDAPQCPWTLEPGSDVANDEAIGPGHRARGSIVRRTRGLQGRLLRTMRRR